MVVHRAISKQCIGRDTTSQLQPARSSEQNSHQDRRQVSKPNKEHKERVRHHGNIVVEGEVFILLRRKRRKKCRIDAVADKHAP